MSDVQFEDGSYAGGRFDKPQVNTPVLVKFLLKTGLVKTDEQANYVLIGARFWPLSLFFITPLPFVHRPKIRMLF